MAFVAETNAVDLIRSLVPLLAKLRTRDTKLADEAKRAARSIAANVAEGAGRFGRDRTHFYEIAYGSGRELRIHLALAELEGHLASGELAEPRALLERELGLLWGNRQVGVTVDLKDKSMVRSYRIAV